MTDNFTFFLEFRAFVYYDYEAVYFLGPSQRKGRLAVVLSSGPVY